MQYLTEIERKFKNTHSLQFFLANSFNVICKETKEKVLTVSFPVILKHNEHLLISNTIAEQAP